MTMKICNKLIRDKIPEIIQKEGTNFKTRILDNLDFKEELLKKLLEESQEVVDAKDTKAELEKEIGDVLEVIDYIISSYDLDMGEIVKVKNKRKESRGGFDEKVFLEYMDV